MEQLGEQIYRCSEPFFTLSQSHVLMNAQT